MAATHPDWPYSTRVRVLEGRLLHNKSFRQLAREIPGITAGGASHLEKRFRLRYPDLDAEHLLIEAGRSQREGVVGRRPRIAAGSAASLSIRRAIRSRYAFISQPEAANRTLSHSRLYDFNTPLKPLDPCQVHNIAVSKPHCMADPVDQRPITRKRAIEKTSLDRLNLDDRRRYCDYLLSLPASAILINCDETPIDYGGSAHAHVSAPAGETVYIGHRDPRFTHMQWAAASSEIRLPRPHLIWEPETEEDAEALLNRLRTQQAVLDGLVLEKRQKAAEEGSPEWRLLQLKNSKIAAHNSTLPRGSRKGRKVPLTPEQLFPMEKIERNSKKNKGGIDSIFYAFEVYQKLLFPYYREVKRLNSSSQVYIVEDNVSLHHRARRLMAPEIQAGTEDEIHFLETPAFSPDLAPIEQLHHDQKRLLLDYRLSITSASRATKAEAGEEAKQVWQSSEFDAIVARKLSIHYFQGLATRSKHADPPYSNRYRDRL